MLRDFWHTVTIKKAVLPNGKIIVLLFGKAGLKCYQAEPGGEFEPFDERLLYQTKVPPEWFKEKRF